MASHGLLRRSAAIFGGGILAAALVFGAGSTGFGASSAASAATPPSTPGPNYVALGDSYSAGYGLTPLTGLPVPGCAQSSSNYPHLLAAALGLSLTDVTCSGAVAANITDTPQVTPAGTNEIQSNALSASTNIVTVTIGGNDLGFTSIAETCAAISPTGPTLLTASSTTPAANCKSLYFPAGGTDSLAALINTTVSNNVSNALSVIHAKAPNAKIFVLAYPALAPDATNTPTTPAGCFSSLNDGTSFRENAYPFTLTDVPYLNSVESQLDGAIQTAANAVGATFVPLFDQSTAHTPCAGTADPYLNGITLSTSGGIPVTGTPYYLASGALHPNTAGTAFMENQAQSAIEAAFVAPSVTSGTPSDGAVDAPYSFAVTASGFPAPTFQVSAGALPDGLSLDSTTGAITGTPITTGSSTFSITATSLAGSTTSPQYTVSVSQAPALTSGAPTTAVTGVPYSFTVTASGFPAPTFHVSAGALPDGLSLDSTTGAITGTPTTAGSSTFSITATNATGSATSPEYSITVAAPVSPMITSGTPPSATVGTAYSFAVTASGVPSPTFAVSSGALPAGLGLDAATGKITGTPSTAGSFTFTLTASNTISPAASAQYMLTVAAPAVPAPAPVTPSQPGLANTGSNLVPAGLTGLLALLAGMGLLLVRRRIVR